MSTEVIVSVSQGIDDVSRKLNTDDWDMTDTGWSVGAYNVSNYQYGIGARFLNITIPQGATIDNAKLTVVGSADSSGTPKSRISAEDVDDAAEIADNSVAFDARWAARTSARVDWDGGSIGSGEAVDSPDIAAVIQEIIDRPGWASGHAILIFFDDFEDRSTHGNHRYRPSLQEHLSNAAPKLTINWSPSGGKGPAVMILG